MRTRLMVELRGKVADLRSEIWWSASRTEAEGRLARGDREGIRQVDVNKSVDSVWYVLENMQADHGIRAEVLALSKHADEITGHVGGQNNQMWQVQGGLGAGGT